MNIVVTGAASGIGHRLVRLLGERGHQVIAADIDEVALSRAAGDGSWPSTVTTATHDVRSADDWTRLIETVEARPGGLGALVNVAGVLRVEDVQALKPESVSLQIDVNTKGVILGTQAAARAMVARKAGRIVNIASMAALAPVPGIAVYSASKFAVRGFSLAAAQELEPLGVHVSVVCPDAVDTPMVDYQMDFPTAALTFSGPRILSAHEVAQAVVELLEGKPRLEVVIPWSRGFLAKASMALPRGMVRWITGQLSRKGTARQRQLLEQRKSKGP
jgi:3-oxoacyl-[acyl-carrier protein] reductase